MDKILERYASTRQPDQGMPSSAASDAEITDDLGAFGWLRGVRDRAIMLELRKKTGSVLAIGYGWIEKIEFDPTDGITIHHGGQKIHIKGRNLNAKVGGRGQSPGAVPGPGAGAVSLFDGIIRHRVPWIQEAEQSTSLRAAKDATVVESIGW